GLELRPQPVLELLARDLVPGEGAVLVVDLPAENAGIVAEPPGHLTGDAAAELAVAGAEGRGLRAGAVSGFPAVHFGFERVGILLRKPGRRGGGGGSEDDEDAALGGERDRPVQPVQIEAAFFGLHAAPGELAHANHVDSGG